MIAVILGVVALAVVAALVWWGSKYIGARDSADAERGLTAEAVTQRNTALAGESRADAKADEAVRRMKASEATRNELVAKEADRVRDEILAAPDPIAAFNGLPRAVRAVRQDPAAGAGGDDGGGTADVQSAGGSPPSAARRRP